MSFRIWARDGVAMSNDEAKEGAAPAQDGANAGGEPLSALSQDYAGYAVTGQAGDLAGAGLVGALSATGPLPTLSPEEADALHARVVAGLAPPASGDPALIPGWFSGRPGSPLPGDHNEVNTVALNFLQAIKRARAALLAAANELEEHDNVHSEHRPAQLANECRLAARALGG